MDTLNNKWILIPQNLEKTIWKGVLIIKDRDYNVSFQSKSKQDFHDANFRCDWELKALLNGYEEVLKLKLQQCASLGEFLNEIHKLVTRLLTMQGEKNGKKFRNSMPISHAKLIEDIEKIGWDKLHYLDPTFTLLNFIANDESSREHILTVKINNECSSKPICQTCFPLAFNPKWTIQDTSLVSVYDQFVTELAKYQDFWAIMDELDANCWILEPENPSRSCVYRRIVVGNNASLLLTVIPLDARSFPDCRFSGPNNVILPLRQKWNANSSQWNSALTVLENLVELLETEFPKPKNSSNEDYSMDCSICYAYRLSDEIPEKSCEDTRCARTFHTECLVEWFRSLPNFRQSFNVLFGECPYCCKPMTVKTKQKKF